MGRPWAAASPPANVRARRRAHTRDTGRVNDDSWYWDLQLQRAVPAADRGAGDHLLGPYATRADAENWKAKVEERNEGWEEDDEAWDQAGESGTDE